MYFHATLTHSPEHCWARDENDGKADEIAERIENAEDAFGVSVHSAVVAPNEHTFYFLLEADNFESVSTLLGPPMLQDHQADIVPVASWENVMDMLED